MCTTSSSSDETPFKSDPINNWRKGETPESVMQIPLHPLSSPAELAYPRTLILGLWRIAAGSRMTNSTSRSSKTSPQTRSYPCISQPQSPSSPSLRCSGGCSSESPPPNPSTNPPSSPGGHFDSVINTNNTTDSLGSPSDHRLCSCKSNSLSSSSSPLRRKEFRRVGSWTFLVVIAYLLLVVPGSEGCGPGRGAGRRRAPRKLTPLVYKQHVPNVPENTLSASGLTEGKISRDHHRFKNLVPNYNQDIIFRDDEGSGADRLMTQRCKEKLNTLAISVMNQWPGVKLRVIEGWDEENLHAPHSLHYEGRAVDITTSDKDRSKYGMLARLAVEAGFDWVYYESRAHIHCSVKSDSTQTGRTGGCFSGNSTVETPTGPVKISEISAGDQILTLDSEGNEVFSDVLLFLDRNATERREFFELQTASGSSITLTPSHLVYTVQPESLSPHEKFLFSPNTFVVGNQTGKLFLDTAVISFAKNVQIGDWVLVKRTGGGFGDSMDNGIEGLDESATYDIERVVGMEVRVETGVYAPLTSTGNLLVDGVLASCYAVIDDQDLAHYAFLPVRLSHNLVAGVSHLWRRLSGLISLKSHVEKSLSLKGESRRSSNETRRREDGQGVHWYANYLYSLTKHLLPSHLMYDA